MGHSRDLPRSHHSSIQMNNDQRKKILSAACKKMIRKGWTISDGLFVSHNRKMCCPIGAMGLVYDESKEECNVTMRKLKCGDNWIANFVAGFDSSGVSSPTKKKA